MSTRSPSRSVGPRKVLALLSAGPTIDDGAAGGSASPAGSADAGVVAALDATVDGRSLRNSLGVNYDAILLVLDSTGRRLSEELGRWQSAVSHAPALVDVMAVDVPMVSSEWSSPNLTPRRLIVVVGPASVVPDRSGPWQDIFVIGPRSAGDRVGRDNHYAVVDRHGIDSLRQPAVAHAVARWLGLPPLQITDSIWLGPERSPSERDTEVPAPTRADAPPPGFAPPSSPPTRSPASPPPAQAPRPAPRTRSIDAIDPFPMPASPPPSSSRHGVEPPAAGTPVVPVAQHLMAQTVSALAPRTEAAVSVTLSGSELMPSSSNVGVAGFQADPTRTLTVFARSKGPIEIVDTWRRELPVQATGASARCEFVIRAVAPGVGSVVVSAFQGSDDLASIELPLTVQAAVPTVDRQQLQTRQAEVTSSGPARVRNQLRVYRDGPDGYTCELMMPSVGLELRRQIRPQGGTPERLKAILESVGRLSALSLNHGPALDDHLLGLGRRIQEWFLPPEFIGHLWEQRSKVDRLEVLSDEPHLPWELCAVSSPSGDVAKARPFLGERGVTRRWPNVVGVRSLAVRRDRRFLIAPTYPSMPDRFLPRGATEAGLIESRFGAQRVSADLASVSSLIRHGDYDLLHFVGHGWSSFGPVDDSRLILDDSEFLDGQTPTGFTSEMVRTSDRHPVVFLNGCETGRISTCIGGFAVAFMKAGAGLFIGTQWEVEDGPAGEFAEALYGCLFDEALTLSETIATVRARRGPVWTATPLAYVAYGDPDAKVAAD